MTLKIVCTDLAAEEGRELEEFLEDLEGVETARIVQSDRDLQPGYLQASASETHLLVTLMVGAGGTIGATLLSEASKDLYKGAKAYILERLDAWKKARLPEERRLRVTFEHDEQGEIVIVSGEKEEETRNRQVLRPAKRRSWLAESMDAKKGTGSCRQCR